MARRAGAQLINMEFIQFHPTTFFHHSSHRRFLISEAIRGEGGILVNHKGERFMEGIHPDAELAPRDVVARAISEEMIKSKEEFVYLDISFKDSDWIKKRFPTIYNYCLERRVDITKEPIPVVPAAHYTCGGIQTNLWGRTNLIGLYAVGEVACSGLHGANRLASTSLLECLTFGHRAAMDIGENIGQFQNYNLENIRRWSLAEGSCDMPLISQDWALLKMTMWNYVGLVRTLPRMNRGLKMLSELNTEVQRFYRDSRIRDELIGLRNAVEVANLILHSSLRNQQSIGCFYRDP
jgi:L-aspartate oxidase